MINKLVGRIRLHIPLTYYWIIERKLDKNARSTLDVGCGKGHPMRALSSYKRVYSVGVDLFKPYINEAKHSEIHDDYVLGDVRFLPFKSKSFDLVLCFQVIEHLPKGDGSKLIEQIEEISIKQIIVTTPVGFIPPSDVEDGNPLQRHRSSWMPVELTRSGYEVKGQGLQAVYGYKGLVRRLPRPLRLLTQILSYFLMPVVYFFPNLAAHMICVKRFQGS